VSPPSKSITRCIRHRSLRLSSDVTGSIERIHNRLSDLAETACDPSVSSLQSAVMPIFIKTRSNFSVAVLPGYRIVEYCRHSQVPPIVFNGMFIRNVRRSPWKTNQPKTEEVLTILMLGNICSISWHVNTPRVNRHEVVKLFVDCFQRFDG